MHLYVASGGLTNEHLIALTPARFKTEYSGIIVEFQRAPDGTVGGFKIVDGWAPLELKRVDAQTR